MKRTAVPLAAAVLLAGAVAASPAAVGADGSASAGRGTSVEVVTFQPTTRAGPEKVTILRGAPVAVPKPPAPYAHLGAAGKLSPDVETLGGARLWLVDRSNDRLTACTLRKSTQVSRQVIRCHGRTLPRRLRGF